MTFGADQDLSEDHSRRVAAAVREELSRRRISRQQLADDARISLSTLEKALAGRRPFTLATTIRLETALGVTLRPTRTPPPSAQLAPDNLGAYSRQAVAWLEGEYLTLRPSFETEGALYAYVTEIRWDEEGGLRFREQRRLDASFAQSGWVALPHQSGHVYLTTNEHGQMRLAVLSRPLIGGEMYGLLTTLVSGRGGQLTPASVPFALIPAARMPEAALGRITQADAVWPAYRAHLDRTVAESFARFVLP